MRSGQDKVVHFVILILLIVVVVAVSFLLKVLFSSQISELTVEILAAVLGVVLVVASVGVTIHFQSQSETERGFRIELFQTKVETYQKLLKCIAKIDDDDHIDDKEVEAVRNRARAVALIASPELVEKLADLVKRLDEERQLGNSVADKGSFRAVVQAMREDLNVVEGDVKAYVRRLVDK